MVARRNASICVLAAVLFASVPVAQAQRSPGFMVPDAWGTLTGRSITGAELICAGKALSSQRLEGAAPWWKDQRSGDDLEAHEAEFQIDHVIRGPQELTGSTIKVQFVGSNAGRPSFAGVVKDQRCLICATKPAPATFRLLFADVGSFTPAGPKPDLKAETPLTQTQRLERELVSLLSGPDRSMRIRAIRYVGSLGLSGPELTRTLVTMRDGQEADLALQATLALVRLGHRETLLGLDGRLKSWKEKGVDAGAQVGNALRGATKPETVPVLIRLLSVKDEKVREGAAFALRFGRSPNTVAALAGLLDDPNVEVRFSAVNGLYRQTDVHREWFPNIDEFKKDPDSWTRKWKGWWEQEGKAKYPSVEDVLQKDQEGKGN